MKDTLAEPHQIITERNKMKVQETTYEEVLMKILVVEAMQDTSPQNSITRNQLLERMKDWEETNCPIGVKSLLERARFLDAFEKI